MKFKFKKYAYLLNDFTNFLLKKDRIEEIRKTKILRRWLVIFGIILILSLALNIYIFINL